MEHLTLNDLHRIGTEIEREKFVTWCERTGFPGELFNDLGNTIEANLEREGELDPQEITRAMLSLFALGFEVAREFPDGK